MRIVGIFLNPEIRTGGHKRYLEFFNSAAKNGHSVFLILNKNLNYQFEKVKQIKITYNYKKTILPYSLVNYYVTIRNKKLIIDSVNNCDYIVIFGETHFFAGLYLKRLFTSKILFSLRSNSVVETQVRRKESSASVYLKVSLFLSEMKYRLYEKIYGKNSEVLVFQSYYDKNSFLSRNPICTNKSVVVSGNINERWFYKEYEQSNSSTRLHSILFLGALNTRKGVKYLIYAVKNLINSGFDITLVVAGEGYQKKEMEEYVKINALQDRISFLGKISNSLEEISKADLLVVPSLFDSFPNVILEAIYVGTPVIGAISGGIPEMLDDAALFQPASEKAIFNLINKLYFDTNYYFLIKKTQKEKRKYYYFNWAEEIISYMK